MQTIYTIFVYSLECITIFINKTTPKIKLTINATNGIAVCGKLSNDDELLLLVFTPIELLVSLVLGITSLTLKVVFAELFK
ncbi:MAG: hypothetical protein LBD03_04730 [Methanobrevibacter sp.]|jgi:hypothetical protein|nr:hypothetical protein [Candidatus Methanovirga procula]